METPIEKTLENSISDIWEKYCLNKQGWADLARMYVEVIDVFENGKEQIQKLFSEKREYLSKIFWNRLEDVGRGVIHWRLLPGLSEGNAPQIRRLPFSVQSDIISGKKFPLLLQNDDHILVDARTIDKNKVNQLFAYDHIRNLDEQKVHQCDITKVNEAVVIKEPYNATSKGLVIEPHKKRIVITKAALRNILLQL